MRTAVIADIHANFAALESVLADIAKEQVDDIISLGDNIGYGPDPEEVVQALMAHGVSSIMGNHEYALVNDQYFKKLNPDPKASLKKTMKMLSPEGLAYSSNLPQFQIVHGGRFVHGCPPKSTTAYLFQPSTKLLSKLFSSIPEMICFFGHTHAFDLFEEGTPPGERPDVALGDYSLQEKKKYIINPGSVGQPRDGINNDAKYLIWDRKRAEVTFKAVPYDVMKTVNKMRELDFPEFSADRLLWKGKSTS